MLGKVRRVILEFLEQTYPEHSGYLQPLEKLDLLVVDLLIGILFGAVALCCLFLIVLGLSTN